MYSSQLHTSVLNKPFLLGPGMQWFQRAGTRILAETTNISIFTDLKPTEIMGCNHLLYFLLATVLHSK